MNRMLLRKWLKGKERTGRDEEERREGPGLRSSDGISEACRAQSDHAVKAASERNSREVKQLASRRGWWTSSSPSSAMRTLGSDGDLASTAHAWE